MTLQLLDIAGVLKKYEGRYRWLDVFASEVKELAEPTRLAGKETGEDTYQVVVNEQTLELVLDRPRNLARFRLLKKGDVAAGAALGAATGVLVGALVPGLRSPGGLIFALLVGGLAGAGIAASLPDEDVPVDENRVLTLAYDPSLEKWEVYHGPYRNFAKAALYPHQEEEQYEAAS